MSAYAKREGVSLWALSYWRKRLRAMQAAPTGDLQPRAGFVPVRVTAPARAAEPVCSVMLGEGLRIDFSQPPAVQWLVALSASMAAQVR